MDGEYASLTEQVKNILEYIISHKLISSSISNQSNEVLESLSNKTLYSDSYIESLVNQFHEQHKYLEEWQEYRLHNKDLSDAISELERLRKENGLIQSNIIRNSIELTNSVQKNTNQSFQISELMRTVEFLEKQNSEMLSEIKRLRDVNNGLQDKLTRIKLIDNNGTDPTLIDLNDKEIVYYVEFINQFISDDAYVTKTTNLDEAISVALSIVNDKTYTENIYVNSQYNGRIISRCNINEKVTVIKHNPFYNDTSLESITIHIKNDIDQINKISISKLVNTNK